MLAKAKALYQVKLILDYLSQEEYNLIPQKTIDYIEDNFEYDENITINPDIPLENQKIDDQTYKILDKIIKQTENSQNIAHNSEVNDYIANVKEPNKEFDTGIENMKLKNLVELLKKENEIIPKVKDLVQEYKDELENANKKIKALEKITNICVN